jgi:hypothetical protein
VRPFHFAAERVLDAPAETIYHCIADYRRHHRVGGFLPIAFISLEVLEGGVGAGTLFRFTTRVGGRSVTRTQRVSEPEPGRVLEERGDGEGSVFTVEPRGEARSLVRIETTLQSRGLDGWLMSIFGPRIMRGIYADELSRLERYAREHGPVLVEVPQAS